MVDNIKHRTLIRALGKFNDSYEHPTSGSFSEWGGVRELKKDFYGGYEGFDLNQLKEDIKLAMLEGDDFWQYLNSDGNTEHEHGSGYHFVAMCFWADVYPEALNYMFYGEDYHHDMLKLLVKKCIWETFWPDEELVEYQQPESGMLPHLTKDYSKM